MEEPRLGVSGEANDDGLSRELLARMIEITAEGVAVIRLETGVFVAANEAFGTVMGYSKAEVLGMSPADLGLVDQTFQEKVFAAVEEKQSLPPQHTRITTKDGSFRDIEFRVDLAFIEGEPFIIGMVSDIGDRLRAQRLVERSEKLFRSVAETAVDAIVCAGADGRITYFNPAAERVFGHPAPDVLGRPLTLLMPERFADVHRASLWRFTDSGEPRVIGRTFSVEGRRADGSEFPVEIALSTSSDEGEQTFTAIIRDLTERDKAERVIRDLAVERERQRLLDRMVEVVEEERSRLALELHDGPIQHLSAMVMRLHAGSVAATTEGLEEALGKEIADLRSMMGQLSPMRLSEYGLAAAIEELVADVEPPPAVSFDQRESERLAPAAEMALYRITQEALTNAIRHANAQHIIVLLNGGMEQVELSIADDGVGIDPAAFEHPGPEHFGLAVMRERAEMVGGSLSISSEIGGGTTVKAMVPRRLG